jgi:hypothetical protein
VTVCKSGNPDAVQLWATDWIHKIVRLTGLEIASRQPVDVQRWIEGVTDFATKKLHSGERSCVLADAQFVIARSHGFTSWPGMAEHIEQLTKLRSSVAQFELAADAVVAGDIRTLDRLLRENPGLVRERSKREHRATLLHYTSANGIEGYRQKTPKNIVDIADLLLTLVVGITGRIRDFSNRNAESHDLNCRSSLESGQTLGLELPQPQVSAFPLWQLG